MPRTELTEKQKTIVDNLNSLIGAGQAAFYRDACYLMSDPYKYETTTHLVSHLLREIESALRDVLLPLSNDGEKLNKKQNDKKELHRILRKYSMDGLSEAQNILNQIDIAPLPDTSGNHAREIKTIIKSLDIDEENPIALKWLSLASRSETELQLPSRAHRESLMPPREVDNEFIKLWSDMEAIFLYVLDRSLIRPSPGKELIDRFLREDHPTKEAIKDFKKKIREY